jgi:hypothetical protein
MVIKQNSIPSTYSGHIYLSILGIEKDPLRELILLNVAHTTGHFRLPSDSSTSVYAPSKNPLSPLNSPVATNIYDKYQALPRALMCMLPRTGMIDLKIDNAPLCMQATAK